jgi:hypothetical protein
MQQQGVKLMMGVTATAVKAAWVSAMVLLLQRVLTAQLCWCRAQILQLLLH